MPAGFYLDQAMRLPRYSPVLPDAEQLQFLMRVAGEAADAAARVTTKYFRQNFDVENKAGAGSFDPVTVADREAELAIRHVLRNACPDIGFFGEEHEVIASDNGLMWVVDPIDGTRAFMSGMPLWGTLIGLYNGQDAILGLMDQPFFKERYIACAKRAELISGQSTRILSTRHMPDLSDAVGYCTTPDMFSNDAALACFNSVKNSLQLMRYGGDCYAYGLLAAGHIDIVLDGDLQPYDIQALIPIVEAAGGVVSNWSGDSAVDGGYVVATGSRTLHDKVIPLLRM